jgi:hypothetical protein
LSAGAAAAASSLAFSSCTSTQSKPHTSRSLSEWDRASRPRRRRALPRPWLSFLCSARSALLCSALGNALGQSVTPPGWSVSEWCGSGLLGSCARWGWAVAFGVGNFWMAWAATATATCKRAPQGPAASGRGRRAGSVGVRPAGPHGKMRWNWN